MVYHEEGRTSWRLDPSITDTVDPFCYRFLSLNPRGNGEVRITS